MIVYDSLFPKEFCESMIYEGKYAVETSNGNFYRFTYPPYRFAVDVENYLLGAGFKSQCDVTYFSKRIPGELSTYNQLQDSNYTSLIYFINDNYKGGNIITKGNIIEPVYNKGVYFDTELGIDFEPVLEGTQYLLVMYFRKETIKYNKSII